MGHEIAGETARAVEVVLGDVRLSGDLAVPPQARGIVVLALAARS